MPLLSNACIRAKNLVVLGPQPTSMGEYACGLMIVDWLIKDMEMRQEMPERTGKRRKRR